MKTIGKIFITGLFTVLPVLATVYLIVWFFAGARPRAAPGTAMSREAIS